ncbi:MAG: CHRD domain-containing protein [Anaerolineae bacterium]
MISRKTIVLVALAVVLALVFASIASAQSDTVTVPLAAENNSGQTGTVTLTAMGDQTQVVINVPAGPAGTPQPAHIHDGKCPDVGKVVWPLTNVVDGKSTTMVPAKLSDIATGAYAINIHKSAAEVSVYTSCGNIPQMAGAAAAQPTAAAGSTAAGATAATKPAALPTTGSDMSFFWVIVAAGAALALGGLALRRARS